MADWRQKAREVDSSLRLGERYFITGQLTLFLIQAIISTVVISVHKELLVSPAVAVSVTATVFGLTLALAVPWPNLSRQLRIIIPLVNTVAIGALCAVAGTEPLVALMIVPVIELSLRFRAIGVAIGVVLVTGVLAIQVFTGGDIQTFLSLQSLGVIFTGIVTGVIVAALATHVDSLWNMIAGQSARADALATQARRDRHVLDVVLNTLTVGVISIDSNGRPLVVNAWQRDLVQSSTGVTNIQRLEDLALPYVERDGETLILPGHCPVQRALHGETFSDMVVWLPTKRGLRALSTSARATFSSDGDREGTVIVTQDVTDNINALSARDMLVASVSHELRTPLTSVIGYLEMAGEDSTLNPQTSAWIEHAITGSERLLEIVSDLLSAASLESGKFILAKRPVNLTDIISDSVDFMRPLAKKRKIMLMTTLLEAPIVVDADAQRLRQAFDNILVNAAKYSEDGTTIRVTQTADDEVVRISIADEGIGMTQEDAAQATSRFFRSKPARKSGVEGTGLGLYIARSVVSEHKGSLEIESAPGVGTTVTITLPRIGRVTRSSPIVVSVAKG